MQRSYEEYIETFYEENEEGETPLTEEEYDNRFYDQMIEDRIDEAILRRCGL